MISHSFLNMFMRISDLHQMQNTARASGRGRKISMLLMLAGMLSIAGGAAFLFVAQSVDTVTAATGVAPGPATKITTKVQEPDGDWLKITIKMYTAPPPSTFYERLYAGELDVIPHAQAPAPKFDTQLATTTNASGRYRIYVLNAKPREQLLVHVIKSRSKGNKQADLVSISVSNQIGWVNIEGHVGSFKCYDAGVGSFRASKGFDFFETASNVNKITAGTISNALITTISGSIGTIESLGDMRNTEVRPGSDRYAGKSGPGPRDIKLVKVKGRISHAHFYLAPASYGDDWEQPTGHLTTIRVGTQKSPGLIEYTDILSSNGVDVISAAVGSNVTVNGVVQTGPIP